MKREDEQSGEHGKDFFQRVADAGDEVATTCVSRLIEGRSPVQCSKRLIGPFTPETFVETYGGGEYEAIVYRKGGGVMLKERFAIEGPAVQGREVKHETYQPSSPAQIVSQNPQDVQSLVDRAVSRAVEENNRRHEVEIERREARRMMDDLRREVQELRAEKSAPAPAQPDVNQGLLTMVLNLTEKLSVKAKEASDNPLEMVLKAVDVSEKIHGKKAGAGIAEVVKESMTSLAAVGNSFVELQGEKVKVENKLLELEKTAAIRRQELRDEQDLKLEDALLARGLVTTEKGLIPISALTGGGDAVFPADASGQLPTTGADRGSAAIVESASEREQAAMLLDEKAVRDGATSLFVEGLIKIRAAYDGAPDREVVGEAVRAVAQKYGVEGVYLAFDAVAPFLCAATKAEEKEVVSFIRSTIVNPLDRALVGVKFHDKTVRAAAFALLAEVRAVIEALGKNDSETVLWMQGLIGVVKTAGKANV